MTDAAQAIRFDQTGGPEVLRLQDVAVAAPAHDEVLVQQQACGVNYLDIYYRTGLYPMALPGGCGVEAAGVIAAVGANAGKLAPGMRVGYVTATPGAYATHRIVKADRVVPLPHWLDSPTAAAVLLQGLTAHYLLHSTYPVQPGTVILLHAAAGGVGSLLGPWAVRKGATIIGVVGSAAKIDAALKNGCAHVIDSSREDFTARVQAITGGKGVDVVYDSVGQSSWAGSLQSLKPRGMMVSFGQASGAVPSLQVGQLGTMGSLFLTRPSLFHYIPTQHELLQRATSLFLALKSGAVKVPPIRSFALRDAAAAHAALEGRQTVGKVILTV
ncbi:MAG: quinone oxidoreductase [Alphaproteobacteria bacterium]